ncbi:aldehyde-activating protein [Steroidobacter agaridevorans]|uniref:Aldehyde-activating protein n=1 Tax=Steroidobacter agaridevorans TaxID=2695856 RepID=A0A829YAR5_9GAMM|nr:GFA family protein [Steroidobacter agaridevorans]GFE79938.1 aldehyde-activating protein [Steroidobacter agaridevorans]GFE90092.1 aldehyde-activating protein [Steroidobacter agaridevorans]
MKQTYSGGCHCGAVRFEADVDLSQGTLKCNCSICSKARAWLAFIGPADFRLLRGADMLSDYQFGPKNIHHLFCRTCGIKSFGRARTPDGEGVAVMVSCLENISPAQLAALPVMYVNGLHDDFQSPPEETRHL